MKTVYHIVHIIPTLRFGGAERFVVDVINQADPTKFRFSIITFFNDNPLAAQITNKNTSVIVVSKTNKLGIGLTEKINQKLSELKPDLVHTHLFGADVWGKRAAHQLKIPVLTTEHNINVGESVFKSICKKHAARPSDFWVASSEAIRVDMKRRYWLDSVIPVIHYGIDLEKWKTVSAINYETPLKFLILGRLVKQKGHKYALHALAQLTEFAWTLRIVGSGEEEKNLRNLVKRLQLTDRVTFQPATADVVSVIGQSQIELVPSAWEGLGIVIMEAMAAGRLVVATKTGGIPELLSNETGYLVAPGLVTDWKKTLQNILERDFSKQKHLIQAGQKYALDNFGMAKMIKAYENIYQKILQK